jgi:hypothetical protein
VHTTTSRIWDKSNQTDYSKSCHCQRFSFSGIHVRYYNTEEERFFSPTIAVRPTISRCAYTEHEKAATWYAAEESEKIQASAVKLIMFVERRGASRGNKKYCTPGLEGHTRNGYKNKMMNRLTTYALVLDEQDRQMHEYGVVDYDIIASAYHQAASSCQRWAHLVGLRDWNIASAYNTTVDVSLKLDALLVASSSAMTKSGGDLIELETPEHHSMKVMTPTTEREHTHKLKTKSGITPGNVGLNRDRSIERNRAARMA